jgi:dipeptidyl aminopeptidase/acylaminoacyl peptidase
MITTPRLRLLLSTTWLACLLLPGAAQSDSTYLLPPPEVVEILDAAPAPQVNYSPDRQWMLLVERPAMPSIAEVARPMERLAGMRIDPVARAPYATGYNSGLVLRMVGAPADGSRDVRVPFEGALESVMWSPDSRHFAMTTVVDDKHRLTLTGIQDVTDHTLITEHLNTVLMRPDWVYGGRGMLYAEVPLDFRAAPELDPVPTGPAVQETSGEVTPTRTYQDLLESERDAQLFEHFASSELHLFYYEPKIGYAGPLDIMNLENWQANYHQTSEVGLWTDASVSPNDTYLMRTQLARPFSYLLPYYSFPSLTDVIEIDVEKPPVLIESKPLDQNIPIGGVRLGRRSLQWSLDDPAALVWVTALDGGDPNREADARDAWMWQAAPFDVAPVELFRTEQRASGFQFTEQAGWVVAGDYDRDRRWTRSWLIDLKAYGGAKRVLTLEDRAVRDAYGDPGDLMSTMSLDGFFRVRIDRVEDEAATEPAMRLVAYRAGQGASPEGLRPFLDRLDLTTGTSERLWQCGAGAFESVIGLFDDRHASTNLFRFFTRYESTTVPPNDRFHTLGGEAQELTAFADPTPAMRRVTKELVTYERADGVPLSATLYLPETYREGQRLPLLVWAYPLEYNDASTAGQVTTSDSRFTRVSGLSHLVLLTQGYAILDGATMPIVGDAETMNDRFIEQIVSSAEAAIDFAVERGFADREKVVVGGHSYGAFMTANLLAHSDLFATGIARSGAYNRTLTPFGFQSERRTFWEAPDAYFAVSPFMHADKINEPLLMIHGEIDNNSGTFPMQSERLFQAIKGNGGTARLVVLPAESHGYRARESVLHVQAETINWLRRFIQ